MAVVLAHFGSIVVLMEQALLIETYYFVTIMLGACSHPLIEVCLLMLNSHRFHMQVMPEAFYYILT